MRRFMKSRLFFPEAIFAAFLSLVSFILLADAADDAAQGNEVAVQVSDAADGDAIYDAMLSVLPEDE